MTVGERIRVIRKDLKLNQGDFGERVGLSAASISLLEKDTTTITERVARDICRVYGISRSWLLDGTGEMREATESLEELSLSFTELISEYPAIRTVAKLASKHMTADDWKRVNELLGKVVE